MGTVHLTNGHHGLRIRTPECDMANRVPLTPELLARPILSRGGEALSHPHFGVVRAALQGLMDLRGFDAAVSHRTTLVEGVLHITLPHREWGEITLGAPDNVVLGFSHDSRHDNYPFYGINQWLEGECPNDEASQADFDRFYSEWSSAEKWLKFFQARLRLRIEAAYAKAVSLENEAAKHWGRARSIEMTLGTT